MIESLILNFGALGIVAYVVYYQTTALKQVIETNTAVLYEVKNIILKCDKK